MKRVITIAWLLLAICQSSFGQLGRISGELRYEYHYQDFLYDGILTKVIISNPALYIRTSGSILSPRILSYSLYSSLSIDNVSTSNDYFDYAGSQYSWNRYNLILNFLPYSPVKVSFAAREYSYDYRSAMIDDADQSGARQQEQRIDLSVHQIAWLPTLSLSYVRNRSYSASEGLYDLMSQTLSFSASHATDTTGSYYLTASMNDYRDRLGTAYDRFLTVEFSASRALSARHGVSLSTEYEQYTGYSIFGMGADYSGSPTNALHLNTSVSAGSTVSPYSQYRSVSFGQSASYLLNQYFRCGLGLTGFLGSSHIWWADGGQVLNFRSLGGSASLQHRRSFAGMSLLNTIAAGYSSQLYGEHYNSFNTSITNNVSRAIGTFSVSGYQSYSYVQVRSSLPYTSINNSAGVTINGVLPRQIQSQTDMRFRNDHFPGERMAYRNQSTLVLTQRFNSSFVYRIPFTLGLSASANWYMVNMTGHTYGWVASFASPSFFVRGLGAEYSYSSSYDPYYQREIADHIGSFNYQWRAISLGLRFRYATFPLRVRELWFNISRPF
jgi:hypothetical protein